jgi:hypothetical protein
MLAWIGKGISVLFWIALFIIAGIQTVSLLRNRPLSRSRIRARIVAKEVEELQPLGPTPTNQPIIRHLLYVQTGEKRLRLTADPALWHQLAEGIEVLLQTEENRHVTGFRPVQG